MSEENAVQEVIEPTQKAAIFLMTVGEESAAVVLKQLGPKEVQRIGLTMASWVISGVSRLLPYLTRLSVKSVTLPGLVWGQMVIYVR